MKYVFKKVFMVLIFLGFSFVHAQEIIINDELIEKSIQFSVKQEINKILF